MSTTLAPLTSTRATPSRSPTPTTRRTPRPWIAIPTRAPAASATGPRGEAGKGKLAILVILRKRIPQ